MNVDDLSRDSELLGIRAAEWFKSDRDSDTDDTHAYYWHLQQGELDASGKENIEIADLDRLADIDTLSSEEPR